MNPNHPSTESGLARATPYRPETHCSCIQHPSFLPLRRRRIQQRFGLKKLKRCRISTASPIWIAFSQPHPVFLFALKINHLKVINSKAAVSLCGCGVSPRLTRPVTRSTRTRLEQMGAQIKPAKDPETDGNCQHLLRLCLASACFFSRRFARLARSPSANQSAALAVQMS